MARQTGSLTLDVDLERGVVPISKAASSLAALIKRSRERRQPIIVTQKGYPTGVLLPVDLFVALKKLAGQAIEASPDDVAPEPTAPIEPAAPEIPAELEAPSPEPGKRRGGRRKKHQP